MEDPLDNVWLERNKHKLSKRTLPRPNSLAELQSLIHPNKQHIRRLHKKSYINYQTFKLPPRAIKIAATYIEDAIKVRKPQKRITEPGELSWLSPLKYVLFIIY